MPYKCREQKNRRERGRKILNRALYILYLGKVCVDCKRGEPFVKLEFDHVLPCEKEFAIGKVRGCDWKIVKKELDKCQLLCKDCHLDRTHGEIPF